MKNYTNTKEVEEVLSKTDYDSQRERDIVKAFLFLRSKFDSSAKISNADIADVFNSWIR